MEKRTFNISKKFVESLFKDLYDHIGWSKFYNKYIIVEPIWYIKSEGNTLIDCVCIDNILYNFKKSFGKIASEKIDKEASEFIEQAFIIEDNYIFLCDNPIFFPYNRIERFLVYLEDHKNKLDEVDGLIHYHINEEGLNNYDLQAIDHFINKIPIKSKKEYLGLVISQKNPTKNFELLSDNSGFIINLFDELEKGDISLSGKLFYTDDGLEDCNLLIQ